MKNKEIYALGIMSGTSLDGLDFSLIKSDGTTKINVLFNHYFKFDLNMKQNINKLIINFNTKTINSVKKTSFFKETEMKFNDLMIRKIKVFFKKIRFDFEKLDLIGIHGNTLIHNPKKNISIQLGDFKLLSKKLNKIIIANFRDNDINLGGEGAPLVPIYHQAVFSKANKNIMVVNIGGLSNFSFLIGKKRVVSSDIGPGNALIDKYCNMKFKKSFDNKGQLAKKGCLEKKIVKKWLKKNFLKKKFPRSFDNNFFKIKNFVCNEKVNKYDMLRTITFFSAKIISNLKFNFKSKIDYWVFVGGGVSNLTLMGDIRNILYGQKILTSDQLGYDSAFIESSAFAFISIRTLKGMPSAFPETTGCRTKNICGKIYCT